MLKIREIEVFYGDVQALFGVSLEVNKSEIVTIVGANGAGKSTTLRSIVGLQKPEHGTITFQGERIDGRDTEDIIKNGLCLVPEGRQVFPWFSVRENLRAGAVSRRLRGVSSEEVEEAICSMYELFPRLKERSEQMAWSLSGGEQQMLALARGLISKPRLMLLDEPSLGLAPVLVRDIFEMIKTINEQGTTILLVEQNAHMALNVAHRGYVLEGGRVVLAGTSEELRDNRKVRDAYLGGR